MKKIFNVIVVVMATIIFIVSMPVPARASSQVSEIADNFGYYSTDLEWTDTDLIVYGYFYNYNENTDVYNFTDLQLYLFDSAGNEMVIGDFGDSLIDLVIPSACTVVWTMTIQDAYFDASLYDLSIDYSCDITCHFNYGDCIGERCRICAGWRDFQHDFEVTESSFPSNLFIKPSGRRFTPTAAPTPTPIAASSMNPAPTSRPRRNPIRKYEIIKTPTPMPAISFDDSFELRVKNNLLQEDSDFDTRIELKFSGDNITLVNLNQNDFKKYNADSLIKLPLLVKNVKYEGSLPNQVNGTSYEIYGPSGNKLNDVLYYDDSYNYTTFVGGRALWLNSMYLSPGAEETRYIYVPYDGAGDYIIEFTDSYKTVEIVLPLNLAISDY